jgi:ATP-binding cassette subfamily C (CFTR/MRP) protein 1
VSSGVELDWRAGLEFIRRKEMVAIRKILIIRAANQAMAFSIPTLAAVLSFVTYGSTQDSFDPVSHNLSIALKNQAVIFTSLALFNLLRQPLMFLPRALSTLTDAQTAIQRLDPVCVVPSACRLWLMSQIFAADVVDRDRPADHNLDVALKLSKVTFRWASLADTASSGEDEKKLSSDTTPDVPDVEDKHKPEGFSLDNLDLTVPRGLLVALVGRVGSGKSSLLQGVRPNHTSSLIR